MESLLLLRAVIWDRHETRAVVGSKEWLHVLSGSLQAPTNSTLSLRSHLSFDSFHLNYFEQCVYVCVFASCFLKHQIIPSLFLSNSLKNEVNLLNDSPGCIKKMFLLPPQSLGTNPGSWILFQEWLTSIRGEQRSSNCWPVGVAFYRFDILHGLSFKKE